MLPLEHLKAEHKSLVSEYIPECCKKMCDFTFGNLFIWSDIEHTEIALADGFLFMRSTFNGVTSYIVPWGNGDIKAALSVVEDDSLERGADLSFHCVAEEQLGILRDYFGDRLVVTEQRDYFDYVYTAERLSQLGGRKLHSKKNHVNSFVKKNNYIIEKLDDSNLKECLKFSHSWHMLNESSQQLEAERHVIDCAFANYHKLAFEGLLIRVDGKIVAYALGEHMADKDCFCVHFEKASPEYPSAYATINKFMADSLVGRYEYINREDDAGVEGLRKAKRSYLPEFLVKKYYAKVL